MRAFLRLTNLPIVVLLVFTAVTAGLIGGGLARPDRLLEVAVAITFCSMGARALTNVVDRDMDARMVRTRDRPLPAGLITPGEAVTFGVALIGVGLALADLLGPLWAGLIALGLVDNIVVYNLLSKRKTLWNIVLAAPSGGIPALVGYGSLVGRIDLTGLLLAGLVVLWTPIHIWSLAIRYRDDYARADVPMLPVALGARAGIRCVAGTSAMLAVFTVALPFVPGSPFGYLTLLAGAIMGVGLLVASGILVRRPSLVNAWRMFKLTSPYLAILFVLMATDVAVAPRPW